jgi:cell division protein FtsQ
VTDPNGEVLVHLGSGNYLSRYQTYVANIQKWREKYQKLESVDLRYDGQIIVNPDLQGIPRQPTLTPAAAKAAMAAGVKHAALVNYEKYVTHPAAPAPAKSKAAPKPSAKRSWKRVAPKPAKAKVKASPALKKRTARPAGPNKRKVTKDNSARTRAPHALAAPVTTTVAQKKPSAGIRRETPKN